MPFGRYRKQFRRLVQRGIGAVGTAFGTQQFARKQMSRKKYDPKTKAARKSKSRLGQKLLAFPKGYNKLRDTDRIQQDLGAGGELTKEHVTLGRPQKLRLKGKARKLIKGSEQTQILRHAALSQFMNTTQAPVNQMKLEVGAGACWLHNWYDGSGFWYAPCHIYDITSINNVITTGGAATYTAATPAWRLRFNQAVASPITGVSFANINGYNAAGALTGGVWQAEDTAALGSNAGSQPLRQTIQDWTQARLMCYGSAKMATEYTIEFIQLKEDALHPEFCNLGGITMTGQDYNAMQVQAWEHYVKPYIAHPCSSVAPLKRKCFKVLKTIRFTLQPRLSTETDANVGHCKQINLFYHMNRLCRYDWAASATPTDTNLNTAATFLSNQGSLQTYVHPRARVYLTIRATNVTTANNTTPTTDFCPSYDILLRKKFTTMQ